MSLSNLKYILPLMLFADGINYGETNMRNSDLSLSESINQKEAAEARYKAIIEKRRIRR